MKQATREWIKKAEGDYAAATILSRRRKVPLHDRVCFDCQQSAGKHLKARLEEPPGVGFARPREFSGNTQPGGISIINKWPHSLPHDSAT